MQRRFPSLKPAPLLGLIAALLATIALVVALRPPATDAVVPGVYGDWATFRNWNSPQPLAEPLTGRWSTDNSWLDLGAHGGPRRLTLRLIIANEQGPTQPLTLTMARGQAQFPVTTQLSRYHLYLPPGSASVRLESPLLTASSGQTIGVGLVGLSTARLGWRLPPLGLALTALVLVAALGALFLAAAGPGAWWPLWVLALAVAALALGLAALPAVSLALVLMLPWLLVPLALLVGLVAWRRGRAAAAPWAALALVASFGAVLRFWGMDWDQGYVFHPDEWVFAEAARNLDYPWHPRFFAYGSLPMYLSRFTAAALTTLTGDQSWLDELGRFVMIGRFYTALFSALTLAVIAKIGWRWRDTATGILAAALASGAVIAISNAHYGTTDTLLTFEIALIALCGLAYVEHGRLRSALAMGALLGLSLATKTTAATFAALPAVALALCFWLGHRSWRTFLGHGSALALLTIIFAIAGAPYTVLDWSGFVETMRVEQSDASSGLADYTYQFLETPPYLHQLRNSLLTLGPALLLAALVGWVLVAWRGWRARDAGALLLVAWPLIYFAFIGSFFIKFMRYMLPLLPFWALFAAAALLALTARWRFVGRTAIVLTVGSTMLYGLLYADGVYGTLDPRISASTWVYANLPQGSAIIAEEHDVRMPVTVADPSGSGRGPYLYDVHNLQVYTPPQMEDPAYYAERLAAADAWIVPSRSQHVNFRRFPDRFPLRACLYDALFDGSLGFVEAARFTRAPMLGSWRIDPEHDAWVEETFQVFDHPTVIVFTRAPDASPVPAIEACAAKVAER